MSNISLAFKDGKAFIAFLTCGDPDLETTASLAREAAKNGADIIELSIPFSDPTAEGPELEAASQRALATGTTTDKIFELVRNLRVDLTLPFVFRTYANVVFSYGIERFIATCEDAGVEGLILPDVPFEEKDEFCASCRRHGIDLISFVAPATEERIAMIAEKARGFLYLLADPAVTDPKKAAIELKALAQSVRKHTTKPCVIGCDIASPQEAAVLASVADGIIFDTAIAKIVARDGLESPRAVGAFIKTVKKAMNG